MLRSAGGDISLSWEAESERSKLQATTLDEGTLAITAAVPCFKGAKMPTVKPMVTP